MWRLARSHAKHAEGRGCLDELICAREACGFANYSLFQHRFTGPVGESGLDRGLIMQAPSTATRQLVREQARGTSWRYWRRPKH